MSEERPRFAIEYDRLAAKALARIEKKLTRRIVAAVDQLAYDAHPPGSVKLAGAGDFYRIRVGDYRVIYTVVDERVFVLVLTIAHRREVYRTTIA